MNNLTKTLLGGVALCALATAPALAGNAPKFHVTALHAGRVVNKTGARRHCWPTASCLTYTLNVSTAVPASDFHKAVPLAATFYKWNTISGCSDPKEKLKVPKKSLYGKVHGATETYSFGCPSGLTVFYGDSYKLTDKSGFGQTDTFVSVLKSEWEQSVKYKGTLYLDVSVAIGAE